MRLSLVFSSILTAISIIFAANQVQAWGGRGHHMICEAATFLVEKKELKNFLTARLHTMGHLCNVPDIHWKSLPQDLTKIGNPTHYLDPEVIGLKAADIPLDFTEIIRRYEKKPSAAKDGALVFSIPAEFGSAWWRVDQFFRLAVTEGEKLKTAKPPSSAKAEQDMALPFNSGVYQWMVHVGLMGHFVGDLSQPFHTTLDFDGYDAGHGGIHGFYETEVAALLSENTTAKIVAAARKMKGQKFLAPGRSVLERVRDLTVLSNGEIQKVFALDPVLEKSQLKKEKGMQLKTPAKRKSAEVAVKPFEPFIIQQMARASALLALLWTEAYEKVGEPKISAYQSYQYPFTPDFVAPDYITKKSPDQRSEKK